MSAAMQLVRKLEVQLAKERAMSADLREAADHAAQALSGLILARQIMDHDTEVWDKVLLELQAALKGGKT